MKTYSRKSSRYLKKAFIASNFNEMCRLCLSEVDMLLIPIVQDSRMSYQEWIHYGVDVLVEEGDGLPPNICEECLGLVERTYLFKKKCKASDSKLREHLQLINSRDCSNMKLEFETVNNTSLSDIDKSSDNSIPQQKLVDPGGLVSFTVDDSVLDKTPGSVASIDVINNKNENRKSNLKEHRKEVVSPINDENIVINEVKQYIWKNNRTGEKNVTVCEVVLSDIKKEGEKSNEDSQCYEISHSEKHSAIDIVTTTGNGQRNSLPKTPSSELDFSLNFTENNEVSLFSIDYEENDEKTEGKVQEICQLWDNDEEFETSKEKNNDYKEEEGLVVDVSWEEGSSQKVKAVNEAIVEVKFEENGVIETHKVFTSENCLHLIEAVSERKEMNCFVCNKYFSSCSEMKSHLLTVHKETFNSSYCEICLKSFTSANSLKRHMSVHTGAKPYGCDICGRKFSQTSILKRHRFTHGKKKPFECNFCQKSYTQRMNLLAHLKNHGVRTETVSHRCKLCHKSFVHPSGLSRHLKQHKGIRFGCSQCSKTFSDSSALGRHVKMIHR